MKPTQRNQLIPVAALLAIYLAGCATANRSSGLGGAIGAGAGMALGSIADPGKNGEYRTRNVIIGGALGTMTGLIAGKAIHDSNEKAKDEGIKTGRATAVPIDPSEEPKLIPAQWRAEIVEAKRIGNRFIPRHTEYIITEPARWEEEP